MLTRQTAAHEKAPPIKSGGQASSALGTTSRKDASAVAGSHSLAETVLSGSMTLFGLIRSFHRSGTSFSGSMEADGPELSGADRLGRCPVRKDDRKNADKIGKIHYIKFHGYLSTKYPAKFRARRLGLGASKEKPRCAEVGAAVLQGRQESLARAPGLTSENLATSRLGISADLSPPDALLTLAVCSSAENSWKTAPRGRPAAGRCAVCVRSGQACAASPWPISKGFCSSKG